MTPALLNSDSRTLGPVETLYESLNRFISLGGLQLETTLVSGKQPIDANGLRSPAHPKRKEERFDETVAEEMAVLGHDLRLHDVWGGTEYRSLAEHSL